MTERWVEVARSACLLVIVFVLVAVTDVWAKKKPPLHPINLNTASSAQLQEVPGIGPSTADKILQARKAYGAFKSVDDLEAIKGIGPKRLDKMRKYLTVSKPAQGATPQNAKPAAHAATAAKNRSPKAPSTKPASPPQTQPATASEDEEQ